MAELAELRPVVATAMDNRSSDHHNHQQYDHVTTTTTTTTTNTTSLPTTTIAAAASSFTPIKYSGGFSSSICLGLFQHHADSHSDCCALACCGLFLADRNRFLMTQQLPPPLWQPVLQFVLVPMAMVLLILLLVSPTTTMPTAPKGNVALLRLFLIFLTVVVLTWIYYCRAAAKRREVRMLIQQRMFEKQQQQHGGNPSATAVAAVDMMDVQASHSGCCCCGCYPRDRTRSSYATNVEDYALDYNNNNGNNKPTPARDVCYGLWKLLANLFCGWCCNCWCQCLGMCALAQEDRELQMLLAGGGQDGSASPNGTATNSSIPAPFQRDYITMQPYSEFYPRIQRVRQQQFRGIWEHGKALSELSSHLLKWVFGILALVVISSLIPIDHWIKPLQLLVVFGTLGQALVLMYVVHWVCHRFDLSLDAVIKFFASGFCLCTSMAMLYELLVSLGFGLFLGLIKIIMFLIDAIGYASSQPSQQQQVITDDATSSDYFNGYFTDFNRHHLGYAIFGAFINAYFVAAAVEELTKYFSFWMVEHPDLMKNGYQPDGTRSTTTSHHGSNHNGADATYDTMEGAPPQDTTAMVVSHNDYTLTHSPGGGGGGGNHRHSPMTTASLTIMPRRTYQSIGSAITVAMVATSLGFACAENLLYVFAYSPPGFANEVATLIARCIFPVHPLCAAMQSLGVVHRDLVLPNGKMTFGLGRVLLPAWLLHGTFDFVLMAAAAYVTYKVPPKSSSSSSSGTDDDSVNGDGSGSGSEAQTPEEEALINAANLISLIVSVVIVITGFVYYQCAASRQRRQLRALDDNDVVMEEEAVAADAAAGGGGASRNPDESASWLI